MKIFAIKAENYSNGESEIHCAGKATEVQFPQFCDRKYCWFPVPFVDNIVT